MVVAKRVNGEIVDLHREIEVEKKQEKEHKIEYVLSTEKDGLEIIRHSCAHLLAQAVQRLYPKALKAIGPATKDGFYYDFDIDVKLSNEDLNRIEIEMKRIVKERTKIERSVISKDEAIQIFSELGEKYKVDILSRIDEDSVTIYRQGSYIDLCKGPHLPHTGYIKAFKLISLSGAYWLNDKNNQMLQRIYGYCFATKEDLNRHIEFMKEVEKRDHRTLGKSLSLFMTNPMAVGNIFWLHKGVVLRDILETFSKELHLSNGYQESQTPTVLSSALWQISGHLDNYRENMYETEFENQKLLVKPMNCPGNVLIYKNGTKSYRDLPLKIYELGRVFRRELSGALHGLLRLREFTQDDAHIFLTEEMIEEEIIKVTDLVDVTFKKFGFKYRVALSTRPDKYIGDIRVWDRATDALKRALDRKGYDYAINEGDGSFYGPKIDYSVSDAIGREWQCSTIQLDFNLPKRFDLEYVDKNNEKKRPIMIHRAIYGSVERFIGILIEHYEGKFPLWLAPVQIVVSTISEKSSSYAQEVYEMLKDNFRVELDISSETIGQKIRKAATMKVPIQIVVGQKESENRMVNVRRLGIKDNLNIPLNEMLNNLKN